MGAVSPSSRATKMPSREKPEMIADSIRAMIVSGDAAEGDSLGREQDLVDQFGVSRPSLREALRILEAEGLIRVVRGVFGGVVVRQADQGRGESGRRGVGILLTSTSEAWDRYWDDVSERIRAGSA